MLRLIKEKPQAVSIKAHRLRLRKAVKIYPRLWYYCGQTKNHRQFGGDFSQNGGPEGDRTLDFQIANLALSQLSYEPVLPLFARFSKQKADI